MVEKTQVKVEAQVDRKDIADIGKEVARLTEQFRAQRLTVSQLNAIYRANRTELNAAATLTGRLSTSAQQHVNTLRLQNLALRNLTTELQQANQAARQQETGVKRLVTAFTKWGLGAATLFFAYRRLRSAVSDLLQGMLKNTEEMAALEEASLNARAALDAAFGDEVRDAAEEIAKAVNWIASEFEKLAIKQETSRRLYELIQQEAEAGTISAIKAASAMKSLRTGAPPEGVAEMLGLDITEIQAQVIKDIAQSIQDAKDRMADDSAERKMQNAISSLVSEIRKANQALDEHNQKMAEIEAAYEQAVAAAQGAYFRRMHEIQIELAENIADINLKAQKRVQKAYQNYQDQLAQAQKNANRQREANEKQHQIQMEFMRRRHQLTMLQNERMYQYSRGLLVAEGDVLAIEDLDARYKLEQQAAEENFQLQLQQAEALFRVQAKIMQEAMRDQVAALQQGLRQQLQEIEENRREQVAEAEKAAAKEEQRAAMEWADQRATDLAEYKEQEADQIESQDKRLQDLAEFLAEFAHENEVSVDDVIAAWERVNGPNGALRTMTKEAYGEIKTLTEQLTPEVTRMFDQMEQSARETKVAVDALAESYRTLRYAMLAGAAAGGMYITPGGREYPLGRGRGYQYGGEFIASQPTPIMVGEGGGAERVTVQPLSAQGVMGTMVHKWGGGAIPVHGTGQLSGLDLTAFGDALAQGLLKEMMYQRATYRGERGR